VTRILAGIYKLRLDQTTKCTPPECKDHILRKVTSPAHVQLARHIAAHSAVLLKNEGDILPLRSDSVRSIAIIGAAAAGKPFDSNTDGAWNTGDYYSGGGSGHMSMKSDVAVTTLDGLRRRAKLEGIEVYTSPSNDVVVGTAAAQRADVAIVVAGATSGEGLDRANLLLDGNANELISRVGAMARRTIVLMQIPGVVVVPWKDDVDGILALFMGGQETGNAWADVLFGDVPPRGRLPVSLPESEADAIPPGPAEGDVPYSEGMANGYRSKVFNLSYPFGYGLTYTTFEYLPVEAHSPAGLRGGTDGGSSAAAASVTLGVRNTGPIAGSAVAQLYLQMPKEAGHPAPMLKGFQRTGELRPGETASVTFDLTDRDLSYYDEGTQTWVLAPRATAYVGESARHAYQSAELTVGEGGGRYVVAPGPAAPGGVEPAVPIFFDVGEDGGVSCLWQGDLGRSCLPQAVAVAVGLMALAVGLVGAWRFRVALFGDYKLVKSPSPDTRGVARTVANMEVGVASAREGFHDLLHGCSASYAALRQNLPTDTEVLAFGRKMPAEQKIAALVALITVLTISIACVVPKEALPGRWATGHKDRYDGSLQKGITGGYVPFRLQVVAHPDKCLDVAGGALANGTPLQIWDCADNLDQSFVHKDGKMRWQAHPHMCVDVVNHNTSDGARMQIWECLDDDYDQVMRLPGTLDGPLQWATHPDKCLDITDHVLDNGNRMQMWGCQPGNDAQQWKLTPYATLLG